MAFLIWAILTTVSSCFVLYFLFAVGLLTVLTGIIAVGVVGLLVAGWMYAGTGLP